MLLRWLTPRGVLWVTGGNLMRTRIVVVRCCCFRCLFRALCIYRLVMWAGTRRFLRSAIFPRGCGVCGVTRRILALRW